MASPSEVTLKLLIDKKANKVLFAEAGKEAVDFLCSILTLPMGTVIRLLSEQGMVGCLSKLYQSIENLNDDYVQDDQHKDTILKPTVYNSAEQAPLFRLTDDVINQKKSETIKLYKCSDYDHHNYVTNMEGTRCPDCYITMTRSVIFLEGKNEAVRTAVAGGGGGGFVKGVVTYMVMDDLEVAPMSTITSITMLNKFNVKDVGALEEKVVHLDMVKGLKLLKTSFQSKNVLTDVFL